MIIGYALARSLLRVSRRDVGGSGCSRQPQFLSERSMIVTAIRVDGKNLGTGAYQKDILIADMPEQGLAGKVA
jgi:hypothetical protein